MISIIFGVHWRRGEGCRNFNGKSFQDANPQKCRNNSLSRRHENNKVPQTTQLNNITFIRLFMCACVHGYICMYDKDTHRSACFERETFLLFARRRKNNTKICFAGLAPKQTHSGTSGRFYCLRRSLPMRLYGFLPFFPWSKLEMRKFFNLPSSPCSVMASPDIFKHHFARLVVHLSLSLSLSIDTFADKTCVSPSARRRLCTSTRNCLTTILKLVHNNNFRFENIWHFEIVAKWRTWR